MKYLSRARLGSFVCASVVIGGAVAAVAPQAAYAATVTTTEKGTVSCTVLGTAYTLPLKTKTTYNNSVVTGHTATASNKTNVTVIGALNYAEYSAGFRSYNGNLNASGDYAYIDSTDGTPSPYNASSNNTITIAPTNIPVPSGGTDTSSKLKFKIASLGPITAGAPGTSKEIAGDAASGDFALATVNLYTQVNEGGSPTTISVPCGVPTATGGGQFIAATIKVT